jgi:hypothetical protein
MQPDSSTSTAGWKLGEDDEDEDDEAEEEEEEAPSSVSYKSFIFIPLRSIILLIPNQ